MFAKELGSRDGADPIPPSQYLFFLGPDQPALQRLLAWVRSKTIRFRPHSDGTDGRSPFAVDEKGKPLGLADMSRELHWKLPFASRTWKLAERHGLVVKEGRKLRLAGNVPKPAKGKRGRNVNCTDNLPESIQRQIFQWDEAKQVEFRSVWAPAVELEETLKANRIAEARFVASSLQDTILSHYSLQRKRRKTPATPSPVILPEPLRHFVQITSTGAVQITAGLLGTDNQLLPVRDHVSLLPTEKNQSSAHESSSSVAVLELAGLLQIDDDAATTLWEKARAENPSVTPRELQALAALKLKQIGKRVVNRTGLLMTAVPKMAHGALWTQARELVKAEDERRAREEVDLLRLATLYADELQAVEQLDRNTVGH